MLSSDCNTAAYLSSTPEGETRGGRLGAEACTGGGGDYSFCRRSVEDLCALPHSWL